MKLLYSSVGETGLLLYWPLLELSETKNKTEILGLTILSLCRLNE